MKKMSVNNPKLLHQIKIIKTEDPNALNEESRLVSVHSNSLKLFYVSLSYKFDSDG